MEDLAALVATIYVLLAGVAVVNIVLTVLAKKRKLRPWIAMTFNALTGFAAIFGISIACFKTVSTHSTSPIKRSYSSRCNRVALESSIPFKSL